LLLAGRLFSPWDLPRGAPVLEQDMKVVVAIVCAVLSAAMLVGLRSSAAEQPAKYTIGEVMKLGQASGLAKKVATGKGDKADAKKLLELYTELAKNQPPAGDADSWKKKTTALIEAARAAVAGDEKAGKLLKASALNCYSCHNIHKG